MDELSFEYYLTGQMDLAISLRRDAIQDWRLARRVDRTGDDLRWLSRLYWFQGNKHAAKQFSTEAIDLLEQLPPGKELAMAYSNQSQLHMLAEETEPAITWGNRALELAEKIRDDEIILHALTNIGAAELLSGDENGLKKLERGLSMALAREMHDHVARSYANIATNAVIHHDYQSAEKYLSQGIAYTADHDMDTYNVYLNGWWARMSFERGDWEQAERVAQDALCLKSGSTVMSLPAVTTLGFVKMRQGQPEASQLLDQAWELALSTGELQRMAPVAAARAEAAWWSGNRKQVISEVSEVVELARRVGDTWQLGQLIWWVWYAGGELSLNEPIPLCYRAMMAGDWQTAAAEWERIGCPYERAMALAEGEQANQIQALEIFDHLGARPAASALRKKMRQVGFKGLPRGPRSVTRANPEGLTSREMEILSLLVEGLSNAEIARQLSISLKTVDHHVSTVLAKLNVHSRLEAAATARQKNILNPKK